MVLTLLRASFNRLCRIFQGTVITVDISQLTGASKVEFEAKSYALTLDVDIILYSKYWDEGFAKILT